MITHGHELLLAGALLTLCYVSTGKAHAALAMRLAAVGWAGHPLHEALLLRLLLNVLRK